VSRNRRSAKRLPRKTIVSFLAAVLLFTNASAFAEFAIGGARTLGVGRIQSSTATATDNVAPVERLVLPSNDVQPASIGETVLATPIDRDVTLSDPAPVIVADAGSTGTEGEWQSGLASAYGLTDGSSPYVAYGEDVITEDSFGVAVPYGHSYLYGRYMEIEYNGIVVVAYINDTGSFGSIGRSLDLQPGIFRAFGFENEDDWGVRTVRFRVL